MIWKNCNFWIGWNLAEWNGTNFAILLETFSEEIYLITCLSCSPLAPLVRVTFVSHYRRGTILLQIQICQTENSFLRRQIQKYEHCHFLGDDHGEPNLVKPNLVKPNQTKPNLAKPCLAGLDGGGEEGCQETV